jgi:hypothetical protein
MYDFLSSIEHFKDIILTRCICKNLVRTPGLAMTQTVSGRPLTAEAPVRYRPSPCGICGEQSVSETGFPLVLRVSHVIFIPPVLHHTEKRKINNHLHHRVAQ